jgi:hypothetical protein
LQNDFGTYDFVDRNASNFQSATVPGSQALRPLISLVAPGNNVLLPQIPLLQNRFRSYAFKSGSSFATAQATGAVALLGQYAQSAVANNVPHWDNDSLKPEVIKAILMNSADKVAGRLGMQKTIYDTGGLSWDSSGEARDIPSTLENVDERALLNQIRQATPTNLAFGTGQLNVRRALDQYDGGEYHPVAPGNVLPTQAWDFNTLNELNGEQTYRLPALAHDGFISITLTWNRDVTLQERGTPNGRYEEGETFQAAPVSNLDLLLVDRDENKTVWASTSGPAFNLGSNQNVEHIFWQLENNHEYNIVVKQKSEQGAKYALAWWADPFRAGGGAVRGTAFSDCNGSA